MTELSISKSTAEVYQGYKDFASKYGRCPSFTEIGALLNRHKSNISYHIKKLKEAGLVTVMDGYRGVRVVGQKIGTKGQDALELTINGQDYICFPKNN